METQELLYEKLLRVALFPESHYVHRDVLRETQTSYGEDFALKYLHECVNEIFLVSLSLEALFKILQYLFHENAHLKFFFILNLHPQIHAKFFKGLNSP